MPVGSIYLTESSPGAPALSGTNGTLCNVLDWALPQKGWAIEYTATNNRIYRPGAGNRNRLFICHDSTVTGGAQFAVFRGCENATAANIANLVNPFPTVAQVANNSATCLVSNATSTAQRGYRIVLTDRFLILATSSQLNSAFGWDICLFGDLYNVEAGDTWATVCHVPSSSSTSTSSRGFSLVLSAVPSAAKTYFCRSIDGSTLSTRGCISAISSGIVDFCSVLNTPAIRGGYGNRVEREKLSASCIGSSSSSPGILAIIKRGWIPNLWNPIHSSSGGVTSDDTFTDSAYAAGSGFTFLLSTSNVVGILETTDTWSPPLG